MFAATMLASITDTLGVCTECCASYKQLKMLLTGCWCAISLNKDSYAQPAC